MSRCKTIFALSLFLLAVIARADDWKTLKHCRLETKSYGDGDSFHIRSGSEERIIRLYFVDCPETNESFPGRVAEQAAYWNIKPEQTVSLGAKATAFTRKTLAQPFTVITRFQDARGESNEPRYYGFVLPDDGRKDLAEMLVENGLARVFGAAAARPGGRDTEAEWQYLHHLEDQAKWRRLGGWISGSTSKTSALIDINTATQEELEGLPKIGKVLAARIIASRPFSKVEDLERVNGIKAGTLTSISKFVCAGKGK